MNSEDEKINRKPLGVRFLGSSCSLLLVGLIIYIAVAGFNFAAAILLVLAVGGLAGPSVVAGDSIFECLSGIVEMFIDGIQSIFEAIAEVISSIFG